MFQPKSLSSPAPWRTQINQRQLVYQISSILLQRRNWAPLLHTLDLSSKLTPSLFLQILLKTQTHPHISLSFFNWAKSNLKFHPDLHSLCHLIQLSFGSGLPEAAKAMLGSVVEAHPASVIGETMVRACRGNKVSNFDGLNHLIEYYSVKGLLLDGLEVFKRMRASGFRPSVHACNKLLDVLYRKNETRLAWCFYGAAIRDGLLPDKVTWSALVGILSKDGKFERIVSFLNMDFCDSVMYSAVIEGYSKRGDFNAAFECLEEMQHRRMEPDFCTFSSLLDGACRYGNDQVLDRVMGLMMEKGLIPYNTLSQCDTVIQKFSDLGKVNAAMMFFNRASDERIGLRDGTYGSLLKALSKEGSLGEGISLYRIIVERGITINDGTWSAFADLLCREDPCEEGYEILKDIIERGYSPCTSVLSNFISLQCSKHRWREVEDLLNVTLEKGLLLDSPCFCSLVEHYCSFRQIDKAITLHHKMEKLQGSLDIATYNVFLDGLVKEGRVGDAVGVFNYMKEFKKLDGSSFTIIIRTLCRAKELRKAMKLHDEMLKMRLKPDKATYTSLIREFNL